MLQYFAVYKPYSVLSQFSVDGHHKTLKDYFSVPKNVYPVGRLDSDSEGLLLLTNDVKLNHRLLHPSFAHEREYWVQVDGAVATEAVMQLQQGVEINIDGSMYRTKPCKAEIFSAEPLVPLRFPPIRIRANIPATWLKLILTEGKNRQVRKMTAKVGFPTLRLIRYRIGDIELRDLQPGEMLELSQKSIYKKLFHE